MSLPWEIPAVTPLPWETPSETVRTAVGTCSEAQTMLNSICGVSMPDMRDFDGVPGFLKRVRMPDGSVRVGAL